MAMYWLDTVILLLLGVGAGLGAWTGLVKQIVRVFGFAAALLCAVLLHGAAATWLQQALLRKSDPAVADALAYGGVFLAVLLAFQLAAVVVERGLKAAKLKWADRVLGGGLGAIKAALILGAIFLAVLECPNPSIREAMQQSALAPVLAAGVGLGLGTVPPEYTDGVRAGLQRLHEEADRKAKELRDKEAPPASPLP
jgi:membrane protein required for colicin V production